MRRAEESMQSVDKALDVALIVMQNGGSTASADKIFTTPLAIALGLGVGFTIVQLFRREEAL